MHTCHTFILTYLTTSETTEYIFITKQVQTSKLTLNWSQLGWAQNISHYLQHRSHKYNKYAKLNSIIVLWSEAIEQ